MDAKGAPLVSVIVPAYNAARWIEECLNSIASQTLDDFECIIIDDGSTDMTPDLADSFAALDPRFSVIHQSNQGLSSARNAGIRKALGAYLTFVDSDDYVDPTLIEKLVHAIDGQRARISMCDYAEVDSGSYNPRKVFERVEGGLIDQRSFWMGCYGTYGGTYIYVWGKLYSREIFESVRFPDGYIYEDQIAALDLIAESDSIAIVHEALYCYRVHEGGLAHRFDADSFFRACEAFILRDAYFAEKGWGDVRVANLRKLISYLLVLNRLPASSKDPSFKSRYNNLRAQAKRICWSSMPHVIGRPSSAARIIPFMVGEGLFDWLHKSWRRIKGRG